MKNAYSRNTYDNAYRTATSTCNTLDSALQTFLRAVNVAMVDSFYNSLNSITGSFGPFLSIFGEINSAFSKRLCMVNPLEATREAGERTLEWTAERAEEAWEAATSWRRRRRRQVGTNTRITSPTY